MKIESKLQHGWDLNSFLREFGCNSEEELFKILKKNYSRKAAYSYIVRMKKNMDNTLTQGEKINDSFKEQIQVEVTVEKPVEIDKEQQVENKSVLSGMINFFKKLFK